MGGVPAWILLAGFVVNSGPVAASPDPPLWAGFLLGENAELSDRPTTTGWVLVTLTQAAFQQPGGSSSLWSGRLAHSGRLCSRGNPTHRSGYPAAKRPSPGCPRPGA
jgi:hypothetical protein